MIIKGLLSLIFYSVNFLCHAIIILIFTLFLVLIPVRTWRSCFQRNFLQRLPETHWAIVSFIMRLTTKGRWDIVGTGPLVRNGWYVMISNHQSWTDILVLSNIFTGKIPPLKFFMKKELLWQLPIGGLACYALGYPFMSRYSPAAVRKNPSLKGRDIAATKKACDRLRDFPSVLINFLEGTRFTQAKKARQESPFSYLLKPHAGGAAVAINGLHDIASGVINVTICYPKKIPGLWELCCGNFTKIVVRYEVLPITPDLIGDYHQDRSFRAHMQQWFNAIWVKKDALIGRIHEYR